jgi:hypothetical protein
MIQIKFETNDTAHDCFWYSNTVPRRGDRVEIPCDQISFDNAIVGRVSEVTWTGDGTVVVYVEAPES